MNYSQAIAWLESLQMFGAKPGLERMVRLAAAAGHPEQHLRFIHVAGTNGKGSTCAMLESIYRRKGLKVGLFTSPHLVAFAERIQINRQCIPQSDVARLAGQLKPLVSDLSATDPPTFFEVVTLMALVYFAECRCELVIWETGLGGRLDATNIVQPLASVITNIDYDHEKWLGYTLPEIAGEKAGIIKPNTPVILAANRPEVAQVIRRRAAELQAPLTEVHHADRFTLAAASLALPLLGLHQRLNAATAIATTHALQHLLPVDWADVVAGLEQVHWPGRLQRVRLAGQEFVLDGAHNPGGVAALCQALAELYPQEKPAMIVGILRDKNWPQMLQTLRQQARRMLLVTVGSERAATATELREGCGPEDPSCPISCHVNLAEALRAAREEKLVVICGSLYLVGEALELLQLQSAPHHGEERSLNEWGGQPPSPALPHPS
ncbi:MAG: bifunctional folylpolyglutamate synthase/dihydrofolate synthase [Verrucomicrobiae bacterium]|nr:bifunctional folylpolyglutamate synthase/dihydrofolate synthase [Verrucomicrobiae bacterium]